MPTPCVKFSQRTKLTFWERTQIFNWLFNNDLVFRELREIVSEQGHECLICLRLLQNILLKAGI